VSPIFSSPDLLNPKDRFLNDVYPYYKGFENIDGFATNHAGTGSHTTGFPRAILATGATNGSRASLSSSTTQLLSATSPQYYTRFRVRISTTTADLSNSFMLVGFHVSPTVPTLAERQVCFRISNGNILAALGNLTSAQEVDTDQNLIAGTLTDLFFKQIGSVVQYYVDGVLRVTLSSFFPDGVSLPFVFYVSNSAAADKNMLLFPMIVTRGEP